MFAKSYQDLEVYKLAFELAHEIYEETKKFPKEERYSLTDQIRRSSRSVGAQIAEAWAKRHYEKHFISKLTDADGEQQETKHWINTAYNCKYITQKYVDNWLKRYLKSEKMLHSMINKASKFTIGQNK